MALRHGAVRGGQALVYNHPVVVNGVTLWLAPAGHVLGSAQVVLQMAGCRAVVSGDYKRTADPTCPPFEPVACDVFVSEATFALPVFRHPPPESEIARLLHSAALFPERCHAIGAYVLGKTQRLIRLLRQAGYERPIYLQKQALAICALYRRHGQDLGTLLPAAGAQPGDLAGAMVLTSGGDLALPVDTVRGFASGWMGIQEHARRRDCELPLALSDHADWPELVMTLRQVAAGETWVTHGRADALLRQAKLDGLRVRALADIAGEGGH